MKCEFKLKQIKIPKIEKKILFFFLNFFILIFHFKKIME